MRDRVPGRDSLVAIAPEADLRASPERKDGVTARAFVIGIILVIGFTVAGCFSVLLRYEIIGTGYLPRGAICLLLALIAGNAALRYLGRTGRRLSLTANELLLIFAMLLVVGAIAGQEYAQHVYLNMVGIVYYTTPDIAEPTLYLDGLDPMLVPSVNREDPVIRWAFEGLPPGAAFPWRPWVTPLLVWTPFFMALYWMVLCFSAAMAHRWEQEERLLYPLVQVPVEIVETEPLGLAMPLRNPILWIAFGLCCALFTFKMIHAYVPSLPDINLQKCPCTSTRRWLGSRTCSPLRWASRCGSSTGSAASRSSSASQWASTPATTSSTRLRPSAAISCSRSHSCGRRARICNEPSQWQWASCGWTRMTRTRANLTALRCSALSRPCRLPVGRHGCRASGVRGGHPHLHQPLPHQ